MRELLATKQELYEELDSLRAQAGTLATSSAQAAAAAARQQHQPAFNAGLTYARPAHIAVDFNDQLRAGPTIPVGQNLNGFLASHQIRARAEPPPSIHVDSFRDERLHDEPREKHDNTTDTSSEDDADDSEPLTDADYPQDNEADAPEQEESESKPKKREKKSEKSVDKRGRKENSKPVEDRKKSKTKTVKKPLTNKSNETDADEQDPVPAPVSSSDSNEDTEPSTSTPAPSNSEGDSVRSNDEPTGLTEPDGDTAQEPVENSGPADDDAPIPTEPTNGGGTDRIVSPASNVVMREDSKSSNDYLNTVQFDDSLNSMSSRHSARLPRHRRAGESGVLIPRFAAPPKNLDGQHDKSHSRAPRPLQMKDTQDPLQVDHNTRISSPATVATRGMNRSSGLESTYAADRDELSKFTHAAGIDGSIMSPDVSTTASNHDGLDDEMAASASEPSQTLDNDFYVNDDAALQKSFYRTQPDDQNAIGQQNDSIELVAEPYKVSDATHKVRLDIPSLEEKFGLANDSKDSKIEDKPRTNFKPNETKNYRSKDPSDQMDVDKDEDDDDMPLDGPIANKLGGGRRQDRPYYNAHYSGPDREKIEMLITKMRDSTPEHGRPSSSGAPVAEDSALKELIAHRRLLDMLRRARPSMTAHNSTSAYKRPDNQAASSLYTVDHGLLLYPASADYDYDYTMSGKKKKKESWKKGKKKTAEEIEKGGHKKKKHKKEEKKMHKEKKFKGAKKGKKMSKGSGNQGGKKGKKLYKDKGYKKKGFKKVYHKEEFGHKKSYFDEFRNKDFKKKWKKFDDKYKYKKMKKWQAKDIKKAKKVKEKGKKYKDYQKSKWKKKMQKHHEKSSASSKKAKKTKKGW